MVAWEDGTITEPQILMRVSTDRGATFSPIEVISKTGRVAGYPAVTVSGKRFTVLWQEQSPAEAAAHHKAAPQHVDWNHMTQEIWRYSNAAHGHQVVARSGAVRSD